MKTRPPKRPSRPQTIPSNKDHFITRPLANPARLSTYTSVIALLISLSALWVAWGAGMPFISVAFKQLGPIEVGHPFRTGLTFENHGKTPAYTFQVFTASDYSDINKHFQPDDSALNDQHVDLSITPGDKCDVFLIPREPTITQAWIDAIDSGQERVYIYGKATYSDMFYIRHKIDLCFYAMSFAEDGITFFTCNDFNGKKH